MTYAQFVETVRGRFTFAQLRCDERPTAELTELMDTLGLELYETYVARYLKAPATKRYVEQFST